uniref:Putative secreted protein n=1 Tax=Nyssomyia neivai TaxID=330878 RepID=A0A1L8DNQ0_9DIPT
MLKLLPGIYFLVGLVFAQDITFRDSEEITDVFTSSRISGTNESSRGYENCRLVDKIFKHGDEWTDPRGCVVYFCYDGMFLDVDFCADLEMNKPNCYIVPLRPNYDFPYCCPKVVCD